MVDSIDESGIRKPVMTETDIQPKYPEFDPGDDLSHILNKSAYMEMERRMTESFSSGKIELTNDVFYFV